MKYIKKNVQVVEPTINEEGYYVVGNVAIHPDVFHQQYQPLGFTLTAAELEIVTPIFIRLLDARLYDFVSFLPDELPIEKINNLLTRIIQYQDEQ